jgi:hypothetical protein
MRIQIEFQSSSSRRVPDTRGSKRNQLKPRLQASATREDGRKTSSRRVKIESAMRVI